MSHSVPGMRTAGSAWTAFTRSRCATIAILLNFLCISASAGDIGSNTEVKASGFQLFVDGKLFAIKGMNYSPVPIGKMPGGDPPTGGPPYGDYFVPNYATVWKPDIDKIREAGVNVIKLYAGDPKLNAGGAGTAGNWKAFLDYCWNKGNKPVYVIMFSYTKGEVIAGILPGFDGYLTDYTLLVSSTANHPAVFGYMIGNEIFGGTLTQNPTFWANFGKLIDAANAAGLPYGKKPFLTTATDDIVGWPAIRLGELSGKLKNIDAWSINIYRGPTLGVPVDSPFTQYAQLMRDLAIKKPLIFGEWGTPHTTRNKDDYGKNPAPLLPIRNLDDVPESEMGPSKPYSDARPVAEFLNEQWNTIKANLAAKTGQVCVGGCIFEWSDEYWKAGDQFLSEQVGGPDPKFMHGRFAGSYYDEAGFGVTSDVDASAYGLGRPDISRTLFKGYQAVKTFYNASSHSGGELY